MELATLYSSGGGRSLTAAPEWNRLSTDKHKTPQNTTPCEAMVLSSFLCVTLGWLSLGDTQEHPQQHVLGEDVVAGPKPLPQAAELVRDKCVKGFHTPQAHV